MANVAVVLGLTYLSSPQDKATVEEYVEASDDQEYLSRERAPAAQG